MNRIAGDDNSHVLQNLAHCRRPTPLMAAAIGWGALAASSLILGALLGLARTWPDRAVGLVLAFGAGALISAVSFDLAEEGLEVGGPGSVALGLAAGALAFYAWTGALDRGGTNALAIGGLLDGIPEQLVLGIGDRGRRRRQLRPAGRDLRLESARGDRIRHPRCGRPARVPPRSVASGG